MAEESNPNANQKEEELQTQRLSSKRQSLKTEANEIKTKEDSESHKNENVSEKKIGEDRNSINSVKNPKTRLSFQENQQDDQILKKEEQPVCSTQRIVIELPAQSDDNVMDIRPVEPARRESDRLTNRRKQMESKPLKQSLSPINKKAQPHLITFKKPEQNISPKPPR